MTTAAFLLRAGISLALLCALPYFAKADVSSAKVFSDSSAGFSGSYSGTGQAADTNGWDSQCKTVSVTIADTSTAVTLSNIAFDCGALGAHHDTVELTKKADGLYLADKKVGAYSENEIDAMLPYERLNDLFYVVRILKRGDGVTYTEDWLSLQDNAYDQVFEMAGALSPSSPVRSNI